MQTASEIITHICQTQGADAAREAISQSVTAAHLLGELYAVVDAYEARRECNKECHGDTDDLRPEVEYGD